MHTVGQILKETREVKLYTLEEVEKAIKIRKELLIALEKDDYLKLPPPTFVRGFIRNYAKFLDLDGEKLLAIYRREFSEKKHKPYIMDAFVNPVKKRKLDITPSRVLGGVVSLMIITFFVYLWLQYRQFIGPPPLTVISPSDQLTTDNPTVMVEGKTDPEVVVMVNSQEIPVDSSGEFQKEITLSSQVNKLTIVATSKFGQKTALEKVVYLKR
ncbi:MAG: putative transcription regulation protein [Candidatus Daviesbacteria bacterium GW2011_GWA1_41_61]|uniref:Putative transcription regulation protein n=1 Tax=Candidatus Daviesbacteria bacterium GW2011_GWA2_40_9 TaxID=1618424 RepID=A0A0G0WGC9_9BACT|nr:MAG: putative transcription regulation protein [Candidatus Daviesbacteria bacterium GW2011_GWC1_40_9]KKR83345.1 MAG: putative transcription regulation protein [Candidatus Daviesbacteria bacterium GW2011_GWA2_40_9]KKR93224.1 MAG: putative transcription regulation protein [Candidatus Daviesbacteria bacterium GW2011_GWB1_41_15]KKS14712.1 MAG: putative transcription regulation protein [Candidatus Daviesbacteria bacterium GW2011_GWA1_41_61]